MLSFENDITGGALQNGKPPLFSSQSSYRSVGGRTELSTSSSSQVGAWSWSFAFGQSAQAARLVEDDPDIVDGVENDPESDGYHLAPLLFIDVFGNNNSPPELEELPSTYQALGIFRFLKENLSAPLNNLRFEARNLDALHARNSAIVAVCREWMSYLDMVEPDGMSLLVPHIHDFFESGRALTWIEVMATLRHLHAVAEISKTLRRWGERVKRAGQVQDLLEKAEIINAWTVDLEHVVAEYHTCLKLYPGEIYYLSSTLFPKNRPIRRRLEALASTRGDELPANFSERKEWELFKSIRMPSSVTGDPHFVSNDLNRFTFNTQGSLIAFRGSRQVNILSAYTGASVCTFQFPRREPVSATFALNSSALAVSFSNAESQLIDIRSGNLIQKLPSSYSGGLSLPTTPLSHRGHQLEIPARTEELSFVATLLEERTSAAGPNGLYALLNSSGLFTVTDQIGNTLLSRQIRVERDLQGEKSDFAIKRGMAAAVKGKLGLPSGTSQNMEEDVEFKCYDIGTRTTEDIVINKLLSQLKLCDEKSAESGMDISFNTKGTAVILRTTNAFGGNFDLLHVVNVSDVETPRVHVMYSTPHQAVAGFSVNAEGDLIALCPLRRQCISIVRLCLGVEIYRIDLRKLGLSPFVGMTFIPGGSTLMTVHKGGQALFWDINQLVEHAPHGLVENSSVIWNGESAYLNATGNTLALITPTKSPLPLVLRVDQHGNVQSPRIQLPFFDRQGDSIPIALADYGTSILIGRHVCFLNEKPGRRKLSIPAKAKILQCTQTYNTKIAVALLHGKQSIVRVFDPSSSGDRIADCIVPSNSVTNIWGLSFDGKEDVLSVGLQLGGNTFAVYFLTRRLSLLGSVSIPEGNNPVRMGSGKNGKLIVLTRNADDLGYTAINLKVPSNTKKSVSPTVLQIKSCSTVPPAITSQGEVFYLGVDKYDGWIMRVDEDSRRMGGTQGDERIAWCPLLWRSIGSLSLLCASKGETATIVCMNKILGLSVFTTTQ